MTKSSAKKSRRWHLLLVVLLFCGVGVLVALANLRQPMNLVVYEPAEVTNKRNDMANNACYVLAEAVALLPNPPPPIKLKDKDGLEYIYSGATDSIGAFLSKWRPDDYPLMAEYLTATVTALDKAVTAFEKPYFLYPPHSFEWLEREKLAREQKAFSKLVELLFAQARLHACSEDPSEDACQYLYNAVRLSRLLATDGPARSIPVPESADIIRNASPAHQEKIAALLTQLRAGWKPPLNDIDRYIRDLYAMEPGPEELKQPWPVRLFINARLAQLKKSIYRDEALLRKVSCLTTRQYEQYVRDNPENKSSFPQFNAANSNFFATSDGLLTVLALESFYRDRGAYPDSLSELVPQHLPQLPENPFVPDPLFYAKHRDGDYVLNWPSERDALTVHEPKGAAR